MGTNVATTSSTKFELKFDSKMVEENLGKVAVVNPDGTVAHIADTHREAYEWMTLRNVAYDLYVFQAGDPTPEDTA